MPRYFFHIRSPDSFLEDDTGLELRDADQAMVEARQGARDLMAESLKAGRAVDHQRFEVCDETGEVVHVVVFRDVLPLPEPWAE